MYLYRGCTVRYTDSSAFIESLLIILLDERRFRLRSGLAVVHNASAHADGHHHSGHCCSKPSQDCTSPSDPHTSSSSNFTSPPPTRILYKILKCNYEKRSCFFPLFFCLLTITIIILTEHILFLVSVCIRAAQDSRNDRQHDAELQ